MDFKERVKFVREKLLLSQADLAKESGVAFYDNQPLENGLRTPTYRIATQIYGVL